MGVGETRYSEDTDGKWRVMFDNNSDDHECAADTLPLAVALAAKAALEAARPTPIDGGLT